MRPHGPNRFPATVKKVRAGSAIHRILLQVGDFEIESVMTHDEAEGLNLRPGDAVTVFVKPTEVAVQRAAVRTADALPR